MSVSPRHILSHVDLRVRDRAKAQVFYDAVFAMLGIVGHPGETWSEYAGATPDEDGPPADWLAFTEDPHHVPGATRVAFAAATKDEVDRVAQLLPKLGARNIEGPLYEYGPGMYALFFEDPDGNRLEVCWWDAEEAARRS